MTPDGGRLVVVGGGMVAHRLVELLVEQDLDGRWDVVLLTEEDHPPYDRVNLSSYFDGSGAEDLHLPPIPAHAGGRSVEYRTGVRVDAVDRSRRRVVTADGDEIPYDALVLATGSVAFVPPVPGRDLPGCFPYRTLDDLDRIGRWAPGRGVGAVVGGGLLGLEAARALRNLGLETHVVETAPRLMPLQVDDGGGEVLRRQMEETGVSVHTACRITGLRAGADGAVAALVQEDGSEIPAGVVVFAAGVRPRDELARRSGLAVGERGGIVVDDGCRTEDPWVYAIGECALVAGRTWGLVAPGYEMARVVAGRLLGHDGTFRAAEPDTKLKLLGVDVASFGDAFGNTPGSRPVVYRDESAGVYKRLNLSADGTVLLGGMLVGEASAYRSLVQMSHGDLPLPDDPAALLLPAGCGGGTGGGAGRGVIGVDALAPAATVCSCNSVSKESICSAVSAGGGADVAAVKAATRAGTTCGGCVPLLTELVSAELARAGVEVVDHLCEHFPHNRQELFDIIRLRRIRSFSELLAGYGRGRGCDVCRPVVASILASVHGGYILDGEQASLQDTNDHFLANLQRDGTYSVVPRVPGGEITPEQLIVIGEVAREFDLYCKITGGQRIDLFGARVDQLPAIWERFVGAGLESGHAYGKALRTVKSCVGVNWCRYGVQDSTAMAIRLELRYRGLRAPHKIKCAVSGCVRECAEAQGKDVGVIATEAGWNLYVAGNGGARPQHAVLLAADLDEETLVRYIDRFLMYYVRTAGRLERTSTWLNKLEGGIDHVRRVVVDDALGIGAELEADMDRHVDGYRCEWAETLADPERIGRFRSFINDDRPDPAVVMVRERSQPRPARAGERRLTVGAPA